VHNLSFISHEIGTMTTVTNSKNQIVIHYYNSNEYEV